MLVSMKEILDRANQENYAVAAPVVQTAVSYTHLIETISPHVSKMLSNRFFINNLLLL